MSELIKLTKEFIESDELRDKLQQGYGFKANIHDENKKWKGLFEVFIQGDKPYQQPLSYHHAPRPLGWLENEYLEWEKLNGFK